MSNKPSKQNKLGLERKEYVGAKSTLCTGCGHDSVTNHLITALFQSNISPYKVAKLSGIGCSSKTPAYLLNRSHGFNSIHGRMAPLATGVNIANRKLKILGISGDGDTASIGLGGFCHMIRRNLNMLYIIENNGVYGLTKGQFSATSEAGAKAKDGSKNPFQAIDLCSLAVDMGCGFVARSFSGDAKQLVPLISAALHHKGTAVIDVISPCITFANNPESSKSYDYVRKHNVPLHELGLILEREDIKVDYNEGECQIVGLSDGTQLTLRKLDSRAHDPTDSTKALEVLHRARNQGEILTGLFRLDTNKKDLAEGEGLSPKPLYQLTEAELRPSQKALNQILKTYQ